MQHEFSDDDEQMEPLFSDLSLDSEEHLSRADSLGLLAELRSVQFDYLGEMDDINAAIEYTSIALTLTPDDDPSLPALLNLQGSNYAKRFQHSGGQNDVDKAIELLSLALAITPDDDSQLVARLSNLGGCHDHRYQLLSELDDLEKAIKYGSRAVDLASDIHPQFPTLLDNLGVAYSHRFQRLGQLSDLEISIAYGFRAVSLTPDDHPQMPSRLANLGMSRKIRFEHLGELDDLEKAIEYEFYAVLLTHNDHPQLPSRLASLGISHTLRFRRLGSPEDLEAAVKCQSRAVELTPSGRPILPILLSNLGISHSHRFQTLGDLEDLEKSIECGSRAVALTPDGNLRLPIRLANLGKSYGIRYEQLGKRRDMDKALDYQSRALALTPDGHPSLLLQYSSLADLHFWIYQRTDDASHLQLALDSFRKASKSTTGAARDRFMTTYRWAKLASNNNALHSLEAYQATIHLLPHFIWLGTTTNQRYLDLSKAEALATNAAFVAISSSDYSLALEWLEHARCVVWNQSLMLRSPLEQLQTDHPMLATRLQTIAHQLHSSSLQSRESHALSPESLTIEQVAQEHRRLAMEYHDLITEVRKLSGFADFLQPIKATGLVRAAQTGPVVVVNCHEDRCDALLILPGRDKIHHVPLPDFTRKDAQTAHFHMRKSLRSKGIRERGVKEKAPPVRVDSFGSVLAALWYKIVKPVLDFLGYTDCIGTNNLPHITWCPTGVISFLPLHAAGDYDRPRSRVFDYAVSSYTPTVTALLTSTSTVLNTGSQVLAVGQEATPGHSPLPETTRELEYIQAHVRDIARYTQLKNDQATTSAVLDAMEQHDWVHLACHAHQNVNDPTKSGFFLHGGTLDLAAINRRSFKSKGLAFLSACQTATGDEELPDEAIHLASSMLMAGYSSVIATMWSVFDADAPFVTDKVYEQLMRDRKLGNGESGKALHSAVAYLRGRVGEKAFERWVPYIHVGS